MSSIITARSGKDTTVFDSPTFDKDLRIHVSQAVGSASISPGGRDVVLASQQGLHIIDLDSPFSPPRHLRHQTPWIPADVQWSPFAARYYWVVSTSNQRALVWNLELASLQAPIEHTLHAHSRAITDINFSNLQPDLLATCAVDAFVHCWDLRAPARPVISFSDWFAGATQVKWNRQNSHILASSHDKYLHIWDDRKGALPLKTIEAHQTKIYGIDWSRTHESKVVTCSLDRTIKLWDYEFSEVEPERVINTPFPVWRARHTPFGNGVLAMPQRGDHDLHMYDCRPSTPVDNSTQTEPDYRFTGHEDHVKEFLWRGRGNIDDQADSRDFQLVSWGADHELILHRMGDKQLQAIGFHKGMRMERKVHLTRVGAPYKSFRDKPQHPGTAAESTTQGYVIPNPGTSPGMNKAPIPIPGGWADGGQVMTYSGIETRNAKNPQDNGLISWMKGVRFGKRKPSSPVRQTTRRLSIMAGLHNTDDLGQRESLSDEIIHVGEKFTKVTVEEADVSNRHVKISLNGPWASEDKLVFMQLRMDFPLDYPGKSIPSFQLEKASALSEERVAELESDLRKIATGYLIHRRGCIEGFLSYLTGERDLEESISWLGLSGQGAIEDGEAAESSSDEEDGLLGDFGGSESQLLGMEGSMGSGIFSSNTNVPLPRTCGALWAANGQLICFMPPKEEPRSILQKFAVDERNRSRGSREIFEGFGRLHSGQADAKAKSKPSADAFEAEDSDDSSEFSTSSSSSGSDEPEMFLRRFQPPSAWHGGSLRFPRLKTHSTEGSLPASNSINRRGVGSRHKILVKVLEVEDLFPSKRSLASEYLIYGDGQSVCSHNAKVASQKSFLELADIWGFVGLILANKVPLSLLNVPSQDGDIRVLARRALISSQRNDSGLDLSFDEPEAVLSPRETALVKWGNHPFAGSWLIDSLFTYFEDLADIQMLGMLSCVFAQSLVADEQRPKFEKFPESMTCAAQSFDYFPNKQAAFGFYEPIISISDSSRKPRKPGTSSGSGRGSSHDFREQEQLASEPVTPYSTGTSPPMPLSRGSTHRSSVAPSLSTSPEHHRTSIPSATSSFAASVLARPFTLASSPPVRNRLSGEELSSSVPSNAGGNWGKGTKPFSRSNSTVRKNFTSSGLGDDFDGSATEDDEPFSPQSRVKISLKNQGMFDDEGCANVALLNPKQPTKFSLYREVYANMLGAWGLRMQQNEVAKYNGILSGIPSYDKARDRSSQSTLTLGELDEDEGLPDELGPQMVRCCMSCGHVDNRRLVADGKCAECGESSHLLSCNICYQPIAGLYKVCLGCGHAAHVSCLAILFESLAEGETSECEAGCGCVCEEKTSVDDHASFGMPVPQPPLQEDAVMETGFQMLQPIENSTILHRRGSIVEARQAARLRERMQNEPVQLSGDGLRKTRTRSFVH